MLHFKRGAAADGSDRAEYYTRNCKNFTPTYGEGMAPVLRQCLRAEMRECILDGEMMVWDKKTGDYAAFGENRSLGDAKAREENGVQPCYIVFDVLWLNGKSVAHEPLSTRIATEPTSLMALAAPARAVTADGSRGGSARAGERRRQINNLVEWLPHSIELSEVSIVRPNDGYNGAEPSKTHTEVRWLLAAALAPARAPRSTPPQWHSACVLGRRRQRRA
jgi:hypothetical protein